MNVFEGRRAVIVTQHGKEITMAPVLRQRLGVECIVSEGFDTDTLGTFSGEVERQKDVLDTLREKCRQGMARHDCDLAFASEGSFGMHPSIFFARADDEVVMLMDSRNNLEIIGREISMDTNFDAATVSSEPEFMAFLERAGFPEHGVIVRKSERELQGMVKGIVDRDLAMTVFWQFSVKYGAAYVETDMRALYNPKRMSVIETATKKLAEKALTFCPQCNTPGFGITDFERGLPCSLCGTPTRSVLNDVYTCQKCQYTEKRAYPRGVTVEQPDFCDHCNP